jgi:hypothetical protein
MVEVKLKHLNHHKLQIDSNPNHGVEIKSNMPIQSPN